MASQKSCNLNFYFLNFSSDRFINHCNIQPSNTHNAFSLLLWSTALVCCIVAALRFLIFVLHSLQKPYTAPARSCSASHANFIGQSSLDLCQFHTQLSNHRMHWLTKNAFIFFLQTEPIWVYLFGAARACIFRQCITFHPNNMVHLRLCQHSHGAQMGSVCRIQLGPSHIVLLPDSLRLFLWFSYWIKLKIFKIWL